MSEGALHTATRHPADFAAQRMAAEIGAPLGVRSTPRPAEGP